MYRAFNVQITDNEMDTLLKNSNQVYDNFLSISHSHKQNIQQSLDNFLLPDNSIDVQSLEQDWFPSVDTHVFISHSHKDIESVKKLEKWLYQQFGIKSFVDSKVWGYADKLLKKIDDEYCVKQDTNYGSIYDYEKRNISTSHVYMILATSLLKMINKIDYIFFLNTPRSLSLNNIHQFTYSPWIYYELLLLKYIRQKQHPKSYPSGEMSTESTDFPDFRYQVSVAEMQKLTYEDLLKWQKHCDAKSRNDALSILDSYFNLNEIFEI